MIDSTQLNPVKVKRFNLVIPLLVAALSGCATNIGKMDEPVQDTGPTWTDAPFGTLHAFPADFATAPLYVDDGPWPALSVRYRAALAAHGARIVATPNDATYRLHLEGYYRVLAPSGASASTTLDELGKQVSPVAPTVSDEKHHESPNDGIGDRIVEEGAGGEIGSAVLQGRGLNMTNLGVGLGLSAAFEGLASLTGAREKVLHGIESLTGVPRNVPLFCTSDAVCQEARRRGLELTQQVLLAVDVYRGSEKLARRTARADGLSAKPTLDEGFGAAVAALADVTLKKK